MDDAAFDQLSWHDCHIWGLELRAGDPTEGDAISDLALDLDFIVEWLCGAEGGGQFRVAPASLVFHGVTELRIAVVWTRGDGQTALHPASIGSIDREPVRNQQVFLDRPYYHWTITLNWPEGGEIAFGAVGFTQTLLAPPVLSDQQCLSLRERNQLLGREG